MLPIASFTYSQLCGSLLSLLRSLSVHLTDISAHYPWKYFRSVELIPKCPVPDLQEIKEIEITVVNDFII